MSGYRILYIAGIGRNGGTILDRVLGHVPGFVSTGELSFVWLKGVLRDELCNCGEPFSRCPFWREVGARAFGGFDSGFAERMHRLSEAADPSRRVVDWLRASGAFTAKVAPYTDALKRLHDAVADVSGARVVVNSSKFAGYGFALLASRAAPVFVLHLVRDPRATAHSWAKVVRKPEVTRDEAFLKRFSPTSASVQWTYRNVAAELLRTKAAGYRRLRYEDFAARPRETVAELVEWMGEPGAAIRAGGGPALGGVGVGACGPSVGGPFIDDSTVELGLTHTQSGNPSRFRSGRIEIACDDEWKRAMPAGTRRLVTAITLPLATRYGY